MDRLSLSAVAMGSVPPIVWTFWPCLISPRGPPPFPRTSLRAPRWRASLRLPGEILDGRQTCRREAGERVGVGIQGGIEEVEREVADDVPCVPSASQSPKREADRSLPVVRYADLPPARALRSARSRRAGRGVL